ncbi:Avt1 vacuolar transporter [Candida orthopsilosis Co 90-125]|uniref:Avt1 vacuolar transporter n=1 Tax=Candida orthopsilosis (strain 90-125) TaxID=1136231 RepID=H8WZV1_CANO9|nr:Avt1 vacuolar transporter [Candida orthopsilosis Co 90-125]CCG22296.1 Avt1 vacuolar transporter [Candida orthopsilosis Co 90-125]
MSLPSQQTSVKIPKERRRSFMDYGGANSFNNFASSFSRAQQYSGSSLMEQFEDGRTASVRRYSYSPSNLLGGESSVSPLNEEAVVDDDLSRSGGSDRMEYFQFPQSSGGEVGDSESVIDELTPLVPTISKQNSHKSFILRMGSSTSPQTIFNSINTLVGIGLLSIPFGFRLSGWVMGVLILLGSASSTNLTARYLGRILKHHPHLLTYGDISFAYGGKFFSILVTMFFVLDLIGAALTLILLFTDCFVVIWPHPAGLKIIIVSIVFFTSLLPLNILSIFSLLGILATMGIILVVVVCGFIIDKSPGSLLDFAPTALFPASAKNLLFSLGIFMMPWGGHPVFPELYRDMRHPQKFSHASNISFSVTFMLDFAIGATGYLMYGSEVNDSIIKSLMQNVNYPSWINRALCLIMGILPISKLPLVTRPIISSYENILRIAPHYNQKSISNKVLRVFARFLFCCLLLLIALLFTSFGKLMSFLGSAICYTVCLTLPLLFYLKLNKLQIGTLERNFIRAGIVVSISCAVLGTYASISTETTK